MRPAAPIVLALGFLCACSKSEPAPTPAAKSAPATATKAAGAKQAAPDKKAAAPAKARRPGRASLGNALTFHAGFDGGADAAFAKGDGKIHTATSYKERGDAHPGLDAKDVSIAAGKGRFGDALKFASTNKQAVYYPGKDNIAFEEGNWSGTISLWLSLTPDEDLEPTYCDPFQLTDESFKDAAVWTDFTKDDRPRQFRLGVFGDLAVWNPKDIPSNDNPNYKKRVVPVEKPPFSREKWTHVVITYSALGSGKGEAKLYLDGKPAGTTESIAEPFTWDLDRSAIRLGLNYIGLMDDVALFNRPLTEAEVAAVYGLNGGVADLR